MRAPPPVDYPSAPTRPWRAGLSLLVAASAASFIAWVLPYMVADGDSGQRHVWLHWLAGPVSAAGVAVALGGLVGLVPWLAWQSGAASERTLRWDGQDWVLVGGIRRRPDQRGDAALMLDLGPWMLVRFAPSAAGPATWLPLTLTDDRARWAALRGALWNWHAEPAAGAGRP